MAIYIWAKWTISWWKPFYAASATFLSPYSFKVSCFLASLFLSGKLSCKKFLKHSSALPRWLFSQPAHAAPGTPYMCVLCLITQSGLTMRDVMDCSLPGFPVHGIPQARILEWVTIPFSRASSRPRDQTQVSCIWGEFFTKEATRNPIQDSNCQEPLPSYSWGKPCSSCLLCTRTLCSL